MLFRSSLLDSQFDTLEPLGPDEAGLVIDVDQSVDAIVHEYVVRSGRSDGSSASSSDSQA